MYKINNTREVLLQHRNSIKYILTIKRPPFLQLNYFPAICYCKHFSTSYSLKETVKRIKFNFDDAQFHFLEPPASKQGLEMNITNCHAVFKSYIHYKLEEKAAKLNEEMRSKLNPTQAVEQFNLLFPFFMKKNNHKGLNFLYSNINDGIIPNSSSYKILVLSMLENNTFFDEVSSCFTKMQQKGVKLDINDYNTVIETCYSAGYIEQGLYFYNLMKNKFDCEPNNETHDILIKAYGENNRVDKSSLEAKPDLTKILVMDMLEKNTFSQEICSYFTELKQKGVKVDVQDYNNVLETCCSVDHIEQGVFFYNLMQERLKCEPNVETYNILIKAYSNSNKFEKCLALFEKLKTQTKTKPNVKTYITMIDCCLKNNKNQKSIEYINELNELKISRRKLNLFKGKSHSSTTTNTAAVAAAAAAAAATTTTTTSTTTTTGVLTNKNMITNNIGTNINNNSNNSNNNDNDDNIKNNIQETQEKFNQLINNSKLDECINYIESSVFRLKYMQDISIYNSLIEACERKKNVHIGIRCFRLMIMRNIKPDIVTYNSLINNCSLNRELDMGISLLHQMKKNGTNPKIETFNSVIKGCDKENRFKQGIRHFAEISNTGLHPNAESFANIITLCCNNHKIEQSLFYFDEMLIQGLEPNFKLYSIMIKKLCDHDRCSEALKFWKKLKMQVELKNVIVNDLSAYSGLYNQLIKSCSKNSKMDESIALAQEMEMAGLETSHSAYLSLISGCRKSNRLKYSKYYMKILKKKKFVRPKLF